MHLIEMRNDRLANGVNGGSQTDRERQRRASYLRVKKTKDVNCMGAEYILSLIEMKTDFEAIVKICIFKIV